MTREGNLTIEVTTHTCLRDNCQYTRNVGNMPIFTEALQNFLDANAGMRALFNGPALPQLRDVR